MPLIGDRSTLKYVGRKQDMDESQPYKNPATGLSAANGSFVGRQREMAELQAALDDAHCGQTWLKFFV